jgi:hypothetical protein
MEGRILGDVFGGFTHLSEIINDAINGMFALLLYWPFIWLFYNPMSLKTQGIMENIVASYKEFSGFTSSWLAVFIIVLPCIGLLNRSIIHIFVDAVLIKYIFSNGIFSKISDLIRNFSIMIIKRYLGILKDNEKSISCVCDNYKIRCHPYCENSKSKDKKVSILDIENCLNPCWKLLWSFDFVGFRHWIIKDRVRKSYWDWEHFLEWVYLTYYQTFTVFIVLYLTLLIYTYRFGFYSLGDYRPLLFAFIIILLTFALYTEYLHHHIAWIYMNIRFYVQYLIEERKDISPNTKRELCDYMIKEDFLQLDKILKMFPNIQKGNSKNKTENYIEE